MKLLLDTHTLLWVLSDPDRLRPATLRTLADDYNTVSVSVVSLWEIVVKCRIGRLKADVASITAHMAPASKLQWLAITSQHLYELNNLPLRERHRDPFNHLIIAQAIAEGMTLVTQDQNASLYSVLLMTP